jgi:hypothetical protein
MSDVCGSEWILEYEPCEHIVYDYMQKLSEKIPSPF